MRQININNRGGTNPPAHKKRSVAVSSNPTRTSEWIDADGNVIDRRSRKIIRPNEDK